ncbi:hypothetical protein PCE1_004279 [Barthelona sp. PCE]
MLQNPLVPYISIEATPIFHILDHFKVRQVDSPLVCGILVGNAAINNAITVVSSYACVFSSSDDTESNIQFSKSVSTAMDLIMHTNLSVLGFYTTGSFDSKIVGGLANAFRDIVGPLKVLVHVHLDTTLETLDIPIIAHSITYDLYEKLKNADQHDYSQDLQWIPIDLRRHIPASQALAISIMKNYEDNDVDSLPKSTDRLSAIDLIRSDISSLREYLTYAKEMLVDLVSEGPSVEDSQLGQELLSVLLQHSHILTEDFNESFKDSIEQTLVKVSLCTELLRNVRHSRNLQKNAFENPTKSDEVESKA